MQRKQALYPPKPESEKEPKFSMKTINTMTRKTVWMLTKRKSWVANNLGRG
jgi:hypothetical protein